MAPSARLAFLALLSLVKEAVGSGLLRPHDGRLVRRDHGPAAVQTGGGIEKEQTRDILRMGAKNFHAAHTADTPHAEVLLQTSDVADPSDADQYGKDPQIIRSNPFSTVPEVEVASLVEDDPPMDPPEDASLMEASLLERSDMARADPTPEAENKEPSDNGVVEVKTSADAPPDDSAEKAAAAAKAAADKLAAESKGQAGQPCYEGFQLYSGHLGGLPKCGLHLVVSTQRACTGDKCSPAVDQSICCIVPEKGWAAEGAEICSGDWEKNFNEAVTMPLEECKSKCEQLEECHGIVFGTHAGQEEGQSTCVVCTSSEWTDRADVAGHADLAWATGLQYHRGIVLSAKKLCDMRDNHTASTIKNRNPPKDPCYVGEEKANATAEELQKNPPPTDEANTNLTEKDLWPEGNFEAGDPGNHAETQAESDAAEANTPRRRRRGPTPALQTEDIRIAATPPPTPQKTVYYEDKEMTAPEKLPPNMDLCPGNTGIFKTGNEQCQFKTQELAMEFCNQEPRCTLVEKLPGDNDCSGGFGCWVPRGGQMQPGTADGHEDTLVKQTATQAAGGSAH